nr:unnamed protein product [Digitaria exilis]
MAPPLQQLAVLEQSYTAPRRELQLFPEAAATEDTEPPQDQGIPNHVMRPQARYPTTMATLPSFQEWKMSNLAVALLVVERKMA